MDLTHLLWEGRVSVVRGPAVVVGNDVWVRVGLLLEVLFSGLDEARRFSECRLCVRAARREWKRRQERVPSASVFERARDVDPRKAGFASGAAPPGSVKAEGVLTTFLFASNWLLMVLNSS